jgi:pimeloyl-ACP methyl ester carboxylesterase
MCRLISVATLVLLVIETGFAATHNVSKPTSDPTQGDGGVSAFYIWDKEVPATPGKLLRQEALPNSLMLANASSGLRVLYTSTNGIDGATPSAVSGAIYFPKGQAPVGGWPIIAWAHGTTGIADVCAPSWAGRSQRDIDYLNTWLSQGFAIVATDYQGLGTPGPHPFRFAKAEGWSVLDSVRAAQDTFHQLGNSVVIVGQSQGAQAALAASLLAEKYAPKMKLLGTVATGTLIYTPFLPPTRAPQLTVPQQTGGGISSVMPLLGLYSLKLLDSTLNPSEYVSDSAKAVFDMAARSCVTDMANAADQNHLTRSDVLKKSPETSPGYAKLAEYERYPTPRFKHPVFMGAGLADVSALAEGQYNFAMAACSEGSTVEMHYYPGKDHGGTVNASLVDSVPFVKKLMSGDEIRGNCSSIKPPPRN